MELPAFVDQIIAFLVFASYVLDAATYLNTISDLSLTSGKVTRVNGFTQFSGSLFSLCLGVFSVMMAVVELCSLIPQLQGYVAGFTLTGLFRGFILFAVGFIALYFAGDLGIASGSISIIVAGIIIIIDIAFGSGMSKISNLAKGAGIGN